MFNDDYLILLAAIADYEDERAYQRRRIAAISLVGFDHGYVTEDGGAFYITEDSALIYEQEI